MKQHIACSRKKMTSEADNINADRPQSPSQQSVFLSRPPLGRHFLVDPSINSLCSGAKGRKRKSLDFSNREQTMLGWDHRNYVDTDLSW